MKILTKKIFREIRFNKFRSAIIILTVAIAIMTGIGFISIRKAYMATVAAHHENLNNADLRVRLNNYTSLDIAALENNPTIKEAGITDLEGRIFDYSTIEFKNESYNTYLIGLDLEDNTINKLEIEKSTKELEEGGTQGLKENQVLVERHFSKGLFGLSAGAKLEDILAIQLSENESTDVEIAGFVIDSDYLYPVDEQTNYASFGELCIIYMPIGRFRDLLQVEGYNEVLVKTSERSHDASQVADQAFSHLLGADKIKTVIYWDEAPDLEFFKLDNPHDKFGVVFGLFSLLAGATAIYNSLSKLVLAHRTHIGLYGALGARKRDVLWHYIGFGVVLGLIGITIGLLGATGLSMAAVEVRADWHGFTETRPGFDAVVWLGGISLTLAVIIFFSFLAALPILQLTPREAMVAPYSKGEAGKEPLLESIFLPLGLFRKLVTKIPLRTVFMNKKRSLSTVVAVATSMMILISSGSLFYDVLYSMDQNYDDFEKYDVNVVLRQPISEKAIKDWVDQNTTGISVVEGYIYTEVFISDSKLDPQRVSLKAFHKNSTLREYNVIKGKGSLETLSKDQILIGSILARDNGISIGDHLNIAFDQNNTFNVEVVGITGELFDDAVLWSIEALQDQSTNVQGINVFENVNAFVFNFVNGLSDNEKSQLKYKVEDKYSTYAYSEVDETFETLKTLLEMVTGLLILIALLGVGILVLFSFSSMSLAMMDREMEFLALQAMGSKRRTILKIIFLENVMYGLFGLVIGVPLSFAILRPTYDYLIQDMYVPVIVPLALWVIVIVTIILCVFFATSLLAWRTWRSSLPDMLRNRMVS